ncbi:MAG: hypothetical protein KA004_16430 [Verrucomicrobiales bacterium]|nr:hypothetical protein [Verrucomicrobiales bacterium]
MKRSVIIFLCSVVLLASCKSPHVSRDFPLHPCDRIPDSAYSRVWRITFKSIPYVRKHAFYGRYGGSGYSGGPPIDAMDSICRSHDKIYSATRSLDMMLLADKVFAELLSQIAASDLTPEGRRFRDRAVKFMRSFWAKVLAKPPSAWFLSSERPDAPFQSEEDIRRYYLKCQERKDWMRPAECCKKS